MLEEQDISKFALNPKSINRDKATGMRTANRVTQLNSKRRQKRKDKAAKKSKKR